MANILVSSITKEHLAEYYIKIVYLSKEIWSIIRKQSTELLLQIDNWLLVTSNKLKVKWLK